MKKIIIILSIIFYSISVNATSSEGNYGFNYLGISLNSRYIYYTKFVEDYIFINEDIGNGYKKRDLGYFKYDLLKRNEYKINAIEIKNNTIYHKINKSHFSKKGLKLFYNDTCIINYNEEIISFNVFVNKNSNIYIIKTRLMARGEFYDEFYYFDVNNLCVKNIRINKDSITEKKINIKPDTDIKETLLDYNNSTFKFSLKYNKKYKISVSGGHQPWRSPERFSRISFIKNKNNYLDIDMVDGTKNINLDNYIKNNYNKLLALSDKIICNKYHTVELYTLGDSEFILAFLKSKNYIFEFRTPSKKILANFFTYFKLLN